ncbi:MAG: hypothetical protein ACTSRP_09630 [Candidatus Helarchaeota archaeon]
MKNQERIELFNKKAKVNQIRNGIYSFISFFRNELGKSTDETRDILHEMGRNIAKSFKNYWEPENTEPLKMMREIYRVVFKSSAKVREKDGYIVVVNRGCPFCKYPRDADLAGCEIIVGFIEEFFNLMSNKSYVDPETGNEKKVPKLQGKVTASKIFQEKPYCQNVYKIM